MNRLCLFIIESLELIGNRFIHLWINLFKENKHQTIVPGIMESSHILLIPFQYR
jgi:hypothetical protein